MAHAVFRFMVNEGDIDELDEDAAKYVYEELQIILKDIDGFTQKEKLENLKEELIQMQMEQTMLVPSLPEELKASLPSELVRSPGKLKS